MKKGIFSLLVILSLAISIVYAQESLTISTYYPSPYGSYNELQLSPHSTPSATCNAAGMGTMYYDLDDRRVKVCNGSSWEDVGNWNTSGGNTINTNTGTVTINGDLTANNNVRGNCSWQSYSGGSLDSVCSGDRFMAGIRYEPPTYGPDMDAHIVPEITHIYCCEL